MSFDSIGIDKSKMEVYKGLQTIRNMLPTASVEEVVAMHILESMNAEETQKELFAFAGYERSEELFKLMARMIGHEIICCMIGVHMLDTPDVDYVEAIERILSDEQTCDPMAQNS